MTLVDLYYWLRPLVPRRMQIGLRRAVARCRRGAVAHCWPILPSAGTPPECWQSWPDGKRFALVLTHDVESQQGHDKCWDLMAIEERLGFRSSFNLVPERYRVSEDLRNEMVSRGFEVGVHGLTHDGHLFRSRRTFDTRKPKINRYLKEWGSVGFRSPSMRRNLDWIGELDIEYDSSTFDTDPFEPHPHGAATVFPFLVSRASGGCYVELPYTLAQDSTLFVVMKQADISIWKKKLDWIAEVGGMALLDTHPDYMRFDDGRARNSSLYDASLYSEMLTYIREKYSDRYWSALPRDMARFWTQTCTHDGEITSCCQKQKSVQDRLVSGTSMRSQIWIDLDNTPHVPFFKPIIRELGRRGIDVVTTARDAYQVCDVAEHLGVPCVKVGRHYGRNKIAKLYGTFYRALQLWLTVASARPLLAVSHGSRSQLVLSKFLRIPTVLIGDYEYSASLPIFQPSWFIVPEVIREVTHVFSKTRLLHYPGIKEDVYAPDFEPDPTIFADLGIDPEHSMLVTVRPPATEAHYHNSESEPLFFESMRMLAERPDIIVVLLPRNDRQTEWCKKELPDCFASGRVIVPDHALDGLNVIWHSEFVISGGGTMNREAAALGVPVYSIFRGTIGAVDHHLSETGRLVLLETVEDVRTKIAIVHRQKSKSMLGHSRKTIEVLIQQLLDILESVK